MCAPDTAIDDDDDDEFVTCLKYKALDDGQGGDEDGVQCENDIIELDRVNAMRMF